MRVLITGGHGFVGLSLAEQLLAAGWRVRLFDASPMPAEFAAAPEIAGVETVVGDITSAEDLRSALDGGVTHVAHLAAITPDARSDSLDPQSVTSVNVVGTCVLMQQINAVVPDARLLHISSVAVYGTARPESGFYTETSPLCPVSLYGFTKVAAEQVVARLSDVCGTDYTIVRLGPVWGPWERQSRLRPLLSPHGQALCLAEIGKEIVLARPMAGDWLYSRDAGKALACLLAGENLRHRVYNLGGGQLTTVSDFCALLARQYNGIRWSCAKPQQDANVTLSISSDRAPLAIDRLRADTGFSATQPIDTALSDHLEWRAAHYGTKLKEHQSAGR